MCVCVCTCVRAGVFVCVCVCVCVFPRGFMDIPNSLIPWPIHMEDTHPTEDIRTQKFVFVLLFLLLPDDDQATNFGPPPPGQPHPSFFQAQRGVLLLSEYLLGAPFSEDPFKNPSENPLKLHCKTPSENPSLKPSAKPF